MCVCVWVWVLNRSLHYILIKTPLQCFNFLSYFLNSQLLTRFSDTTHIVGNVLNIIFTRNVLWYNMSWLGFLDDVSWIRCFHFISYNLILLSFLITLLWLFSLLLWFLRDRKKLCFLDAQKLSESNIKESFSHPALCAITNVYLFQTRHFERHRRVRLISLFFPVLLPKISCWFRFVYLTIWTHRISNLMYRGFRWKILNVVCKSRKPMHYTIVCYIM